MGIMNDGPIIVLLVEDNAGDARLLSVMLAQAKNMKFEVEWVDRLAKGLERLKRGGIDVVLLDLTLPDSSGLDTFTRVHAQNTVIPIIPLTGLDDELLAAEAVKAGAQDYLVKGEVETKLLATSIRHAIERKRAEEALRQREKQYRTLFQCTGTATIVVENDTIVLANAEFEKLSGFSRKELEGNMEWRRFFRDEDREKLPGTGQPKASEPDSEPKTFDLRFFDRWGNTRYVFMTAAAVPGSNRHVASLLDITRRKRMEEELLRAKKLESISMLAGGIAHDFNNILTVILGNISLARMYANPTDKVYERLVEAEKGTSRAQELTRQLLTFSKGSAPLKRAIYIGDLVKDAVAFALAGSNVGFEFSIAEDSWPVEADEGQMSQVVNDLVINADQAMPNGGIIKVGLENVELLRENADHGLPLQDGKYVRIWIRDHGVGISEQHLPRIFDPYFSTKSKRSGLGLAVANSVVEKHGGHIVAESDVGHGSTFSIYLPASDRTIPRKAPIPDKAVPGNGRILVMDDEEAIRTLAREVLSTLGYLGDFASDGSEAIDLYRAALESNQPYDAVIMDLTVPGKMGGKEALEKLLRIDPRVKAIVSSGYSNDPIMADYKKHGFSGVVPKPYRIHELSGVLRQVITDKA